MSKYRNLLLLAAALTAPAFAGSGGTQGVCIQDGFSLSPKSSTQSMVNDPYSYLLPSDINTTSLEISNSYSINLKPLRADDMSQYQIMTKDNLGAGAGYSSPYLWEAGRAPGGGMLAPTWNGGMEGRSFSPIPMPGR